MVKEVGFTLDWELSRNGNNSMIVYLNEFYLGGKRNRVGLKLQFIKEQHSLMLFRRGGYLTILVFCTVYLVLSMLRHDYRMVIFFPPSWSQGDLISC